MPRKAKETLKAIEMPKAKAAEKKSTVKAKAATTKKTAEKKSTTKAKIAATKKTAEKKSTVKAKTATTKKTAEKKSTAKAKAATTKKTAEKKSTVKAKTNTVKKRTTITDKKTSKSNIVSAPEYYDLPFHYNQTIVKVLAQTPKTLFVYWDISNEDAEKYIKQFGTDFFNNTVPFLRIHDIVAGTSFDVDVDDFANGWYIHVENSNADYSIELLRKQRPYIAKVIDKPIFITSSNDIETPNDHILFDENLHTVFFKNVNTGEIASKDITNISILKRIGKIYNIYDLYKKMYKNEDVGEIFDLNNPSSGNPTSTFK